ncbi:MAG: divalent-cation tolerance protein CutA [bacterium]|nr:divalent-cation tolerance protein CutA [bacterium]
MIFILTTCKNTAEAKRIATMFLRLRLVACAKWWPIQSSYWWKEKLVAGREVMLLLEARKTHWGKIRAAIQRIHSYEIPMIVALERSQIDPTYHRWLHNVTS